MRKLTVFFGLVVGCIGTMHFASSNECFYWYEGNCGNLQESCPFNCEPNVPPNTFCGIAKSGNDFTVCWPEGPYTNDTEGTNVVGGNVWTDNCYAISVCISSEVVPGTGGGEEGEDEEDGLQFCSELAGFSIQVPQSSDFPGTACPVWDTIDI